jgi:Undecaprenyl-phosphate galactose phosphotransferase WbaP
MSEESLNLHPTGPVRLRPSSREDHDLAVLYRYRRLVVVTSLICGDLIAALAATWCADLVAKRTGTSTPAPPLVAAALVVLTFFLIGLYTGSGPGSCERFRLRTIGIAGLIAISSAAKLPQQSIFDFMFVQFSFATSLLLIGHYFEDAIRTLLIHKDLWGASTVIVGTADDRRRKLARRLARKPDLGLKPIGLVRTADLSNSKGASLSLRVTSEFGNRPASEVEVAVFTTASDLAAVPRNCCAFLPSCRFLLLEDIDDIQGLWTRARTIDAMVGIEIERNLGSWRSRFLKRTFDLLVAIPAGLLALPAIALAALMIKLVDPGPAFHVQKRIGRNGTVVKVIKLRTMCIDSERVLKEYLERHPQAHAEWMRFFKLRHDPRVLPIVGNFLRRSSADELPQLWNVVRGEMSLVGPRPLPVYHLEQLDQEFQLIRCGVLPGLTGLWQVSSRSDGDLEVLREHDLFYIRNWSHWLDFYILLQTVPAVLYAKGAR